MIEALKTRISESDHPIGTKRPNLLKVPKEGHVYGLEVKKDPEGVGEIIRSWKTHVASQTAQPPQDFITINKLAIKMNATNFAANKDFRRTVDIRQKMRTGGKEKRIYLPDEDFAYGLPNRPPTPFKDVIYNTYGNRAEEIIRNEYQAFINERNIKYSRPPKVVPRYISPLVEKMKKKEEERKASALDYEPIPEETEAPPKEEKPLYKLKMFQDVGSKVAEGIKQFKTYHPYKKTKTQKIDDGIDHLINKVQGEIKEQETLQSPQPVAQ